MKSTISLIKEIPLDQEVVITQLVGKKDQDKNDAQQLTKLFPNASQEEINKMVLNKFLNENAFSACMDVIYKCCEIKYDDEEVKKVIDDLRKNFKDLTDKKDEQLLNIAQHLIAKPLIFNLLAEKWGITCTDEETKQSLLNFYRDTNQPIKDVLEIPEKFNNAKANFLQQKIIKELTKKFKVKFDLPPPKVTPNVMPKPETEPNKE